MGIFDMIPFAYGKPTASSSGKTTYVLQGGGYNKAYDGGNSATPDAKTLTDLQATLPKGSTVRYDPVSKTTTVYNPNAPQGYDTITYSGSPTDAKMDSDFYKAVKYAQEGKQFASYDILSTGQAAPVQKSTEATMTKQNPAADEYRLTMPARIPSQNPFYKFIQDNTKTKINYSEVVLFKGTGTTKEPFFLGASEKVQSASEPVIRMAEAVLPIGSPLRIGVQAFGDLPRFAVKYGEAIRMSGEESISFWTNPKKYQSTLYSKGDLGTLMYSTEPKGRAQKLFTFGREEVAPAIITYGAFESGGRIIGFLGEPASRAKLKPSGSVYDSSALSRPAEKVSAFDLEKAKTAEGADIIRSLSEPAKFEYGAKSKALLNPDYIPRLQFTREYLSVGTKGKIAGEPFEIRNSLVKKETVRLRKLAEPTPLSDLSLNVKKVELVGTKGFEVIKMAEGRTTGESTISNPDVLRLSKYPKPAKNLLYSTTEQFALPEVSDLYKLSRAVREGKRYPSSIPEPEIPFMKSVYDKKDIPLLPKKTVQKTVNLFGKETFTEGTNIGEFKFGPSNRKSITIEFYPETARTQKFSKTEGINLRLGSSKEPNILISERTKYTFRNPHVEAAIAEQKALGLRMKNTLKIEPTESNPLFRDTIQFEKVGTLPKKTPLKFEEVLAGPVQKAKAVQRIPVLEESEPIEAKAITEKTSLFQETKAKASTGFKSILGSFTSLFGKSKGASSEASISISATKGESESKGRGIVIPILGGTKSTSRSGTSLLPKESTQSARATIIIPITSTATKGETKLKVPSLESTSQRTRQFIDYPQPTRTKTSSFLGGGGVDAGGGEEPPEPKPEKPLKFFVFPDEATTSTRKTQAEGGWIPYAKQGGKFIRLSPKSMTLEAAMGLGGSAVDNTTSAQFKVKRTSRPPQDSGMGGFFNSAKFRKKGNSYIEKNTFRIDTEGEFQGITVKGWLAKKNKRVRISI